MSKRRGKSRGGRPPRAAKEEEERPADGWRGWARDILVAVLVMAVVLVAIFAYTGNWPPLVVVESDSMQHGNDASHLGVIDTGDLVFVQQAPNRNDVVTYIEGQASGYQTYSEYGDVIVFRIEAQPSETPIIHRAIAYIIPDVVGDTWDVPALRNLRPGVDWLAKVSPGGPWTDNPYGITEFYLRGMGYKHDLNITFQLGDFDKFGRRAGYITMGDNNAYRYCGTTKDPCTGLGYDTSWFPRQVDIIGHARGEIPWFGLIKLLASPANFCCRYWGDPAAPGNSWTDLIIALAALIALPFALEGAAWAWSKYAWPWLGPKLRRRKAGPPPKPIPVNLPDEGEGGDAVEPEDAEGR